MRWLLFAIIAPAGIVLQTTVAARTTIAGIQPDWMFVLVVFFGLYAPRRDAWLAGWLLGLLVDLTSIERLGLFSLSFFLVAVMVNSVRDLLFLKSFATHFFITLGAGLLLQCGLVAYRAALYPQSIDPWPAAVLMTGAAALYTAVWAIPIHHVLLRAARPLGLHTSRYTHRGAGRSRLADGTGSTPKRQYV